MVAAVGDLRGAGATGERRTPRRSEAGGLSIVNSEWILLDGWIRRSLRIDERADEAAAQPSQDEEV